MSYSEIKEKQPVLTGCFFAFSNEQFAAGISEKGLEGKKIYRGSGGLYGTKEGIEALMNFYDNISIEITEKCTPAEVYEYEYWNHECEYIGDDSEAMKIVVSYFGEERAAEFSRKRKNGYSNKSVCGIADDMNIKT
jgi:hypothetical protein